MRPATATTGPLPTAIEVFFAVSVIRVLRPLSVLERRYKEVHSPHRGTTVRHSARNRQTTVGSTRSHSGPLSCRAAYSPDDRPGSGRQ